METASDGCNSDGASVVSAIPNQETSLPSDSRGHQKAASLERRSSKRNLFATLWKASDQNRVSQPELEAVALPSLCFPDCVPQAVVVSVRAPSDRSLVAAAIGALDEALSRAKRDSRHSDGALLALTKAAVSNDPALVCKCFGETKCVHADEEERGYFTRLQAAILQGEVCTVLPVRVARRYAHSTVAGELLARTGINRARGHVDWQETELIYVDDWCLHKVHWVKTLNVAHCRIELLPQQIASHLKQVVKLELQFNQLEGIPGCLLELPCLNELNLSHNKLRDIPPVPLWSPALTTLDLSHNDLTTLPGDPKATSLHTLNLSHNQLTSLPPCVCGFLALTTLTLSANRGIRTLPLEMGALARLAKLELGDMDLEDPPKKVVATQGDCLQYLRSKFLAPKPCYQMKVLVLGDSGRGKSTLVARLQGKTPHSSKVTGGGLEVTSWEYKPALGKKAIHFLIWNLKGEKSIAVHQCFLTERCVCLLVFDITRGSAEVKGLRPWLDSLALHAPASCVLLIGTHQDKVPPDSPNMADTVLQMAARLGNEYSTRLCIMEVLGVGLKTGGEELRNTLYGCAEEYSLRGVAVMGEAVPSKYLQLGKLIQSDPRKGERCPVMEEEDFVTLASRAGVEEHELMDATHFLVSVGTVLHYDDPNCRLDRLYFLDPCWLCDAILKMVADCEANYSASKGLMNTSHISVLFEAEKFPWKYFRQFLVFLDKFDIALPIDSQRLLIPSVLVGEGPVDLFGMRECYVRYILFDAQVTLPFWSRLLAMLLHLVPEISAELPTTNPNPPIDVAQEGGGRLVTKATMDVEVPLKHLVYWRTGMAYWNAKVTMRVESMAGSQYFSREGKEGVAITVSRNGAGERVLCQVVDLVMTLANDWYPFVQGRARRGNGIHHLAVCSRCMELNRPLPYEFNVVECLSLISMSKGSIECGYNKPSENHMTPLVDLVPELLLKDIDARFVVSEADVEGVAHSKRHVSTRDTPLLDWRRRRWGSDLYGDYHLFTEFRREATLLHRCGHPCLQGFVGVSTPRLMTIVVESAPLGTLEACLVVRQREVHRVVLHRMVAQMAAGLLYLHDNRIILHGPRTLNDIVVWSLEPDCLCHCKLGNFSAAMRLTCSGMRKVHAIKEGLAPEVGQAMSSKGCNSTYQSSSDIFQLGTVIYQMLIRKCKITQLKPTRVPLPDTSCYYLPLLAQWCQQKNPAQRPSTSDIMDRVSQASFQSLVQLQPLLGDLVMRRACVVTSAHFISVGLPSCDSEFWVFSDSNVGTAIDMYHARSLAKVGGVFVKESCVQSVCVCREHIWVAFRGTSHRGVINLYAINGRSLAHTIDVGGDGVTCMVPYKEAVYCGTLNGCCLAFSERAREVAKDTRRRSNCVSEVPLDCILVVGEQLWVTHADLIHFLNPDTLEVEGYVSRVAGFVGTLVLSSDLVWSAYLGWGCGLSAWSAEKGVHMHEVTLQQHLRGITTCCEQDMVVTAMAPVLDTMWVGTATGHVLIFHSRELLMWFHPYQKHVSLLLCCPSEGGGAMVVSGGRGWLNPVKGEFPTYRVLEGPQASGGVLALWDALDAATCRQVWLVQESSGTFLKNWSSVSDLIGLGKFKDGTWRAEERESDGVGVATASSNGLNDVVVPQDHVEPTALGASR